MRASRRIIDACHSSRSPEHTDAALESLDSAGIRALHMVGAAMDEKASAAHLPRDLERLASNWNASDSLVRVGLFGQLNLDWWKVARRLDMQILTEFIGDLAKLAPQFAEPGILGRATSSITARACPKERGRCSRTRRQYHRQSARGCALRFRRRSCLSKSDGPAIDAGTRHRLRYCIGSGMFGEMHACSATACSDAYRRFRGEVDAPPIWLMTCCALPRSTAPRRELRDVDRTLTPASRRHHHVAPTESRIR